MCAPLTDREPQRTTEGDGFPDAISKYSNLCRHIQSSSKTHPSLVFNAYQQPGVLIPFFRTPTHSCIWIRTDPGFLLYVRSLGTTVAMDVKLTS
ncbi:hypothetical protein E1B28_002780 [Marasmius oreades]|uniref:Uncharacterized protein n=1 Tax=Marasmius oreades TaxID=181124 RepID=A0A9P7RNK2_9AGAR|nr:uncharacterized protein E1B28_002780 [Marasmius oreades]KAG7086859.1 hypothetical protein E1B28_002780 [Marasmius oreades]